MSDSDILERAKAQFDVNRAKEAANRFAEWMLHNPAGTVDISDAVLSAWGYPAAVAEIERLRNLPRADVAAYDRRIQEMAARIKELQDLIDKPPEEADWVADYHLLQSALDGPIIDAARKWHAAYRKAQNSNLMRAKEVKRLRAEREVWIKHCQENSQQAAHIQELEGSVCRSKQTWEATDERIAAMKDACNFLVCAEIRNKGVNSGNVDRAKNAEDVLRAMLAGGKRDA